MGSFLQSALFQNLASKNVSRLETPANVIDSLHHLGGVLRLELGAKLAGGVLTAAALAGGALFAATRSNETGLPCEALMTIEMTPVQAMSGTTGEHTPRLPGETYTYTSCADAGRIVADERDRGERTADRWSGISDSHFGIDDSVVPFEYGDRARRTVTMAFYEGSIAFASSDGQAFIAPIDSVALTKVGKGAKVHLNAVGGKASSIYTDLEAVARGNSPIDRVELSVNIETRDLGYEFTDNGQVLTGCVTLSADAEAVVGVGYGRALCHARQSNQAGAAILKQTFYSGALGLSVGVKADVGLYIGISDTAWIADTLGWSWCSGIGFSVHAEAGLGVEFGSCHAGPVTTGYFSYSQGAGGEVFLGAKATRSYTEQMYCFGMKRDQILNGKCERSDHEKPRKPEERIPLPGGTTPVAPDRLTGAWVGAVTQVPSAHQDYRIIADVGADPSGSGLVGQVAYPELACGGELTSLGLARGSWVFREAITYGDRRCVDGGIMGFSTFATDQFAWGWAGVSSEGEDYDGTAVLERSHAGTALPVGTWEGPVTQVPAASTTYTISLTLGLASSVAKTETGAGLGGTVEYPELGCAGRVELVGSTPRVWTFQEFIESGDCVDRGFFSITRSSGRSVDWAYSASARAPGVIASAVLTSSTP